MTLAWCSLRGEEGVVKEREAIADKGKVKERKDQEEGD